MLLFANGIISSVNKCIAFLRSAHVYTNDFEITLGENEYFCLGDNRPVSKDSRYYGAFSKEEIKSTHFFVYYPFNRIGVK